MIFYLFCSDISSVLLINFSIYFNQFPVQQKSSGQKSHTQAMTSEKCGGYAFACDKCPRKFHKKFLYDAHIRRHMGLKAFQCEHCDKSFVKNSSLKTHMEEDHYDESNGKPEFICDVEQCGKTYNRKVIKHLNRFIFFNISMIFH